MIGDSMDESLKNKTAPWQARGAPPPYMIPLNGLDNKMGKSDVSTQTQTLLDREKYWLYYKGKQQPDHQRDVNTWKPPRHGPIVI